MGITCLSSVCFEDKDFFSKWILQAISIYLHVSIYQHVVTWYYCLCFVEHEYCKCDYYTSNQCHRQRQGGWSTRSIL